MATRNQAHKVFLGKITGDGYLRAITVDDLVEGRLRSARDDIRDTLRSAIRNWSQLVERRAIFAPETPDTATSFPQPRFRMQGSMAYGTLNDPAQDPQEVDLDDGMFIPISFLATNGGTQPALLSQGLFQLVEKALRPLCDRKGWILDDSKPSCVRVRISKRAHIDLAIYSVPDSQYRELKEAVYAERGDSNESPHGNGAELDTDIYLRLASDSMMLAHREEGWKPSDPRKLENWFQQAVDTFGPQLRRVCRYLKGWRDFKWPESKLSSISLMACAVEAFRSSRERPASNRDDLAVAIAADSLWRQLQGPIANPVVPGQYLDDGWDPQMRNDFVARGRELAEFLTHALNRAESASAVLQTLKDCFGDRIPDDESLVTVQPPEDEAPSKAPAVLTGGLLSDSGRAADSIPAVQKRGGDRRYA